MTFPRDQFKHAAAGIASSVTYVTVWSDQDLDGCHSRYIVEDPPCWYFASHDTRFKALAYVATLVAAMQLLTSLAQYQRRWYWGMGFEVAPQVVWNTCKLRPEILADKGVWDPNPRHNDC